MKPNFIPCFVYALKNGDQWSYVGRSVNVHARLSAHRGRGVPFDQCVILANVEQRAAVKIEEAAIEALAPSHNRVGHSAGPLAGVRVREEKIGTSFRIPHNIQARLNRVASETGISATEIMLLGLIRFLDEHRTTDAIIEAVVRGRQSRSREVAA